MRNANRILLWTFKGIQCFQNILAWYFQHLIISYEIKIIFLNNCWNKLEDKQTAKQHLKRWIINTNLLIFNLPIEFLFWSTFFNFFCPLYNMSSEPVNLIIDFPWWLEAFVITPVTEKSMDDDNTEVEDPLAIWKNTF